MPPQGLVAGGGPGGGPVKFGWDETEQKEFLKAIKQPLLVQTPLQVRTCCSWDGPDGRPASMQAGQAVCPQED